MEAAPRSWQFSLANLSVMRKVGIVLLLPVLLASTYAAMRIKDQLGTISQLNSTTERARIIRPMLAYGAATERLSIAAAMRARATSDPELDTLIARFDQTAIDLETALRSADAENRVTTELGAAIAAGRTLRNGLRSNSPQTISEQSDEVAMRIGNAIVVSPSLEELTIQRYFLQLGVTTNARRVFTQEYLMITTADPARNQAVQARILTAAGSELVLIGQYAQLIPSSAIHADTLLGAVQTRLGALGQAATDPDVIVDSLNTSSAAYDQATNNLVSTIDGELAAQTATVRGTVLRDVTIVIATLLAGLVLGLAVARSLIVPIGRLRRGAMQVAHEDLPRELELARSGGAAPEITPVDVHTTEEIGQLARAVDDIHTAALHLSADQARLRLQIGNMFETLSRRSQSLVEQQLDLIEELEHDEDNTERLQSLFRLDHLATRMRRNGDNLLVLAGTALRRGQLHPVQLSDMLWSAVSQVEDYQRVEIGTVPDGIVAGEPAIDIEHLLAELIDNALRYSPPTTPVTVSVSRAVDGGYLIEITDRGLGMSSDDLRTTNERLASGGEVTVETARRMGLFVAGRLAKRHTITVNLRRTSTMAQQPGITASVHLPGSLIAPPTVHFDADPNPLSDSIFDIDPQHPPPRTLVPVPSPPQPEPPRFERTTAGLPQRKPTMRVADHPSVSVPDTDSAPASPVAQPALGHDEPDQPPTAPFRPPMLYSTDDPTPPSGLPRSADTRSVDPDPQQFPSGPVVLWDENNTTAPAQQAEPTVPKSTASRELDLPPLPACPRQGARSGDSPGRGQSADAEAESDAATSSRLQPVANASPTPIYQRMVSEWLVEPATTRPEGAAWTSRADAGWLAAEDASHPTSTGRTTGGLPIRKPGAQLVPGGLAQTEEPGVRDPEEIRINLTRHLSGVRSGRANAQYNDGGLA